ncbi:MAG: DUF1501 domain-containing protein [Gemmataceae bacterium]
MDRSVLSLPFLLHGRTAGLPHPRPSPPKGRSSAPARSCIFVYCPGAPAHQETFDPQPDAPPEYRGEFGPIPTNVPGTIVSEHLPLLSRLADRYCLIRSCNHNDPEHNSACHAHMTGRMHPRKGQIVPPSPDDFPPYGAVVSRLRPTRRPVPNWVALPEVLLNNSIPYPSQNAGFLGGAFDPLLVRGDPNRPGFRLQGLDAPDGVSLPGRGHLRSELTRLGRPIESTAAVRTMESSYQRAYTLLASAATRDAFELSREPEPIRKRYGRHTWGQSLLLARRLVEAGVPLVTVYLSNGSQACWDTHGNNFTDLKNRLLPPFDRGLSALLIDLEARGLLDETLLVVGGEFGRTPQINSGAGRDHWPWVYTTFLAGAGVRGGAVWGSSDRHGAFASANPVSPGDLAATIYHCLGLNPRAEIHDRLARPYPLALGEVIRGIL